MTVNVYYYFHKQIAAYDPPFTNNSDKTQFLEGVRRAIIQHPQEAKALVDCDLYYLGTFDDVSGKFDFLESPEFIAYVGQFFPKDE